MFALALGLWRSTRGAATTPVVTGRAVEPGTAPEPQPSATAPVAQAPVARARPRAPRPSERPPELAPEAPKVQQELKRDANGKLVPIIYIADLRAQVPTLEAPMKACIARHAPGATGKAVLGFIVAAKNGKLAIEATSVQDEDTLAAYPDLLTCMHKTAGLLVVDDHPIPELGTAIYVRRHVRIENGELVENSMFDFSYSH